MIDDYSRTESGPSRGRSKAAHCVSISKVSENQGVFAKEVEMSVTCIPILAGIFIEKYLKDSQFMGLFCYFMLYSHSRWDHHRAGHQVP